MDYESSLDPSLEFASDQMGMYNAEMDLRDAMQSLEKAEKGLYWSFYWVDYAEAHKN